MSDIDKLKDKVKFKIAISQIKEENIVMKKKQKKIFKYITVASLLIVVSTGTVFAKEITKKVREWFNLVPSESVESSVENGYILENDMDYVYSEGRINDSESINVGLKNSDFFMEDTMIVMDYNFIFDENINNYKDFGTVNNGDTSTQFERFGELSFSKMIVTDENNNIVLSSGDEEYFNSFCSENSLDYKYEEFNDNYYETTGKSYIEEIIQEDNKEKVKITHYFSSYKDYPRSKKLNMLINEITMDSIKIEGEWRFTIDIPDVMTNREEITYEMVGSENNQFEIYNATLTNTGLEIGMYIHGIEKPEMDPKLVQRESEIMEEYPTGYSMSGLQGFYEIYGEEYEEMYVEYWLAMFPVRMKNFNGVPWLKGTEGCYVINSRGEKFEVSSSMYKKTHVSDFIDGNMYDYSETMDMSTYDATEEMTLVIDYYGTPVNVYLKRST